MFQKLLYEEFRWREIKITLSSRPQSLTAAQRPLSPRSSNKQWEVPGTRTPLRNRMLCAKGQRVLELRQGGKMELTLMLRTGDWSTPPFKGDQEGKQVLCRRTHQICQNALRSRCLRRRVRSVLAPLSWIRPTSGRFAGQGSPPPSAPCTPLLRDIHSQQLTGPPWKDPSLVYVIKYTLLWSWMIFFEKKKTYTKGTKDDTPSVFLMSSFLLLIWKEAFVSQDLGPVFPSDKERKPQHTGQLHMQTRKEQEHAFESNFGRLDHA